MSKTLLPPSFLRSLLALGLVASCANPSQCTQKELQSLARCKKRRGFLALYDTALRYVALLLLREGYSLVNERAHVVFEKVISQLSCSAQVDGKGVVAARHRLKYKGVPPGDSRILDLMDIVQ